MIKVAVLDDYQQVARKYADWSSLSGDAEVTVFHDHVSETEAVIDRFRGFDVLCLNCERTPMTREIIERLPKLKLLVTTGGWNAAIDMQAAHDRGIPVCGSEPDLEPCTDLAWGLILSLMRNIPQEFESVRNGGWMTTVGRGVGGRTLGVLGLGKIGTRVAKIGIAFGMNVIAWSQNLTEQMATERGAKLVTKDELFAKSDVLTIHVILDERTRNLVGARELALMKPTAYLINTARGPIVNEAALIDALETRRIAGAALDVFDIEPLPVDHPIRRLKNVVLTPHLGGVTEERYQRRLQDSVDDVRAWLDGKVVREFGLNGRLRTTA